MCGGYIAYLGPLAGTWRMRAEENWLKLLHKHEVRTAGSGSQANNYRVGWVHVYVCVHVHVHACMCVCVHVCV